MSDHVGFLDLVARGCASGSFDEWEQLRPACKGAIEEIAQLTRERDELLAEKRLAANRVWVIAEEVNALKDAACKAVEVHKQLTAERDSLERKLAYAERVATELMVEFMAKEKQ